MSASRPSFADSAARTFNRARRRGVAEAASAVWAPLRANLGSSGKLQVLDRPTGGEPEHRRDLSLRLAKPDDAAAYARDIATESVRTFRARLSDATWCYVAESRGRLLHASWVTTAPAWTSELDAFVSPPPGHAYIYESFTRPETRGRGIYPFALRNICADLDGRGIPRAWIAVEATNTPSIRAISKAGFDLAFELRFHRRWGKVQVEPPVGPRTEHAATFVSPVAEG